MAKIQHGVKPDIFKYATQDKKMNICKNEIEGQNRKTLEKISQ